jgi:hypothetical protein
MQLVAQEASEVALPELHAGRDRAEAGREAKSLLLEVCDKQLADLHDEIADTHEPAADEDEAVAAGEEAVLGLEVDATKTRAASLESMTATLQLSLEADRSALQNARVDIQLLQAAVAATPIQAPGVDIGSQVRTSRCRCNRLIQTTPRSGVRRGGITRLLTHVHRTPGRIRGVGGRAGGHTRKTDRVATAVALPRGESGAGVTVIGQGWEIGGPRRRSGPALGRLSGLSVSLSKSDFDGDFVWAWRALSSPEWLFAARAAEDLQSNWAQPGDDSPGR